jgi:hypothetical protein
MQKELKICEKKPYRLYFPKEWVKQGFKGDIKSYANARTITIAHPKATLEEIRESLRIVLQDIELRMKASKENG